MKILLLIPGCLFGLCVCKQGNPLVSKTGPQAMASTQPSSKGGNQAPALYDTLYVHAPSGLVLRKTPSKNGKKIASVPRDGRLLKVLEPADPGNRFTAEKIGSFELSGGWVKVKTTRGEEGWLFEGYLSRYPPLLEKSNDPCCLAGELFYRSVSPAKGERISFSELEETEGHRQGYLDGAFYETLFHAAGEYERFLLPAGKMTMQEALVLFRSLWFGSTKTFSKYDAAKRRLNVFSTDGQKQNLVIELDDSERLRIYYSY